MANRITIPIGTKFGRLTVIDNSELKHLCRCECGTIKEKYRNLVAKERKEKRNEKLD